MIYAPTKFEVATSNGLGEDTITRNVTDGQTDARTTDRLWYEINIPYFSYEKAGITRTPKLLGVVLDEKLTFQEHIKTVEVKVQKVLSALRVLGKTEKIDTTNMIRL